MRVLACSNRIFLRRNHPLYYFYSLPAKMPHENRAYTGSAVNFIMSHLYHISLVSCFTYIISHSCNISFPFSQIIENHSLIPRTNTATDCRIYRSLSTTDNACSKDARRNVYPKVPEKKLSARHSKSSGGSFPFLSIS